MLSPNSNKDFMKSKLTSPITTHTSMQPFCSCNKSTKNFKIAQRQRSQTSNLCQNRNKSSSEISMISQNIKRKNFRKEFHGFRAKLLTMRSISSILTRKEARKKIFNRKTTLLSKNSGKAKKKLPSQSYYLVMLKSNMKSP